MATQRAERRTLRSGKGFPGEYFPGAFSLRASAASRSLLAAALLACWQFLSAGSAAAFGPGTGSANFLKIPVGARETALGGAFTAVADNANAVHYNPAGLDLLQSPEVTFAHNRYLEGVSQQWLAAAYPHGAGVFGFGLNYLSVRPFDSYDNADNRTGSVSADSVALYFSWGSGRQLRYRLLRALSYGVTLKYISETLDTERGSGYGLDLGLLAATPVENLRLGLSVENALSSKITFIEEGARPPLKFKAGAGYQLRLPAGPVLRGSLDCVFGNDRPPYLTAGMESLLLEMLSLRLGYSALGDISNGLSFGLGFALSRYTRRDIAVDYSFAPTYAFGDIHKLGVTYRFGPRRRPPGAMALAAGAARDVNMEPVTLAPQKTPIEYYSEILAGGSLFQRRSAIAELGVRGGEDSFSLLLGLLKDGNAVIVRDTVVVLSSFNDQRVIDPIIELFKGKDENVRLAAISGLARYKDYRVPRALAERLADPSPEVRSWAAEILGRRGEAGAVDPLQAALGTETDKKARRSIISALRKLDASAQGGTDAR